ncbi:MAG: YqgE/AlgH family protein [Rhodospirillales bacterium]|nr:YqgE/AlgH family protein [Rhodospirillales bacterium]
MDKGSHEPEYLSGQLLIAMPSMTDPRFTKTVIYLCAHNSEGAMGLVINKPIEEITFPDLLAQLQIQKSPPKDAISVLFGGPVEQARGFVLHSAEYIQEGTMRVNDKVGLTATVDILRDIAEGQGPKDKILALGYAGWGPGQLDAEIRENGWLHVAADDELVFGHELSSKWELAIQKIGIDPSKLSDVAGHA